MTSQSGLSLPPRWNRRPIAFSPGQIAAAARSFSTAVHRPRSRSSNSRPRRSAIPSAWKYVGATNRKFAIGDSDSVRVSFSAVALCICASPARGGWDTSAAVLTPGSDPIRDSSRSKNWTRRASASY
jgi:hypothetical protein